MNFVFTIVLVAIVSCAHAVYTSAGPRELIKEFFEDKCRKHALNDNVFKDLTDVVEYLPQCFKKALGDTPPNPFDDFGVFCNHATSPDFYMCLNNFTKKISPCLDEDEAYFPDYVLTSINASLEACCTVDHLKRIGEMVSDINGSDCLDENQLSLEVILSMCVNNLIISKNIQNEVHTLKKDDLCSDIHFFKRCLVQNLQDICKEDHADSIDMLIYPYLISCYDN